jgi:hypothetical protein
MVSWMMVAAIATALTMAPAAAGIGDVEPHVLATAAAVMIACLVPAGLHGARAATWIMAQPLSRRGPPTISIAMGLWWWMPSMLPATGALVLSLLPPSTIRLVLLTSLMSISSILSLIGDGYLPGIARELVWQERRALLTSARQHGHRVVVLPPLPATGAHPHLLLLTDLAHSPNGPWNGEVARWYGVGRIWVAPDRQADSPLSRRWWLTIDADLRHEQQDTLVWDPR